MGQQPLSSPGGVQDFKKGFLDGVYWRVHSCNNYNNNNNCILTAITIMLAGKIWNLSLCYGCVCLPILHKVEGPAK